MNNTISLSLHRFTKDLDILKQYSDIFLLHVSTFNIKFVVSHNIVYVAGRKKFPVNISLPFILCIKYILFCFQCFQIVESGWYHSPFGTFLKPHYKFDRFEKSTHAVLNFSSPLTKVFHFEFFFLQ